MPDITMCTGEGCPLRETCYRYKAAPNEFRQSWFVTPPFKTVDGKTGCEHYDDDRWDGLDEPNQ